MTQALARIRQAARTRKKERFTALLHHVDVDLLRIAFLALQRKAAPGVDELTWRDYEAELEPRLTDLHARVQRGAYRPQPLCGYALVVHADGGAWFKEGWLRVTLKDAAAAVVEGLRAWSVALI